jgi:hypothetical protein
MQLLEQECPFFTLLSGSVACGSQAARMKKQLDQDGFEH